MLTREHFPPDMPKEDVDRLLEIQSKGRWQFALPVYLAYGAAAFVLFGGAQRFFGFPAFTWALFIPAVFGIGLVERFFTARRIQKLLVGFGRTCPKCHEPLHTDTWSMAKGEAERDALIQGYCPRCFEHIAPNVLQQVDAGVAHSEARRDVTPKG